MIWFDKLMFVIFCFRIINRKTHEIREKKADRMNRMGRMGQTVRQAESRFHNIFFGCLIAFNCVVLRLNQGLMQVEKRKAGKRKPAFDGLKWTNVDDMDSVDDGAPDFALLRRGKPGCRQRCG